MCAARMGAQGPDCGSFFVLSLHLLGPQHCSVGPTSTDLFLPARQPSGLTVIPPEMSALGQRCEVTRSRSSTTLGRPGSPGPSAAPTWPLLGPPPPPPTPPPAASVPDRLSGVRTQSPSPPRASVYPFQRHGAQGPPGRGPGSPGRRREVGCGSRRGPAPPPPAAPLRAAPPRPPRGRHAGRTAPPRRRPRGRGL